MVYWHFAKICNQEKLCNETKSYTIHCFLVGMYPPYLVYALKQWKYLATNKWLLIQEEDGNVYSQWNNRSSSSYLVCDNHTSHKSDSLQAWLSLLMRMSYWVHTILYRGWLYACTQYFFHHNNKKVGTCTAIASEVQGFPNHLASFPNLWKSMVIRAARAKCPPC